MMLPIPGDGELRTFYEHKKVILYWLKRAGIALAILAATGLLANLIGLI
jgi:hypothetical protein